VARLNANNGQKIGPSLVLRVMAGDTIQAGVKAFYKSTGTSTSSSTSSSMVIALLQVFAGSGVSDGAHYATGGNSPLATNFGSGNYDALKQQDPNQNLSDKPKAYLNYVLFDDRFNMVGENSGVKQVQGSPDALQTLATDRMVVKKTGFLYIYTNNESGEDVFFDNLVVALNTGPLLEETHYSPFGGTLAGISSKALQGTSYFENRLKYNGKELQSGEFNDGSGLMTYDYGARMYDQQIGRWMRTDPLSEISRRWSPYNYAYNNPVRFIDPDGMNVEESIVTQLNQDFISLAQGNYHASTNSKPFDWVHDRASNKVLWDPNVHSASDVTDPNKQYLGKGGILYGAANGGLVNLKNGGDWDYAVSPMSASSATTNVDEGESGGESEGSGEWTHAANYEIGALGTAWGAKENLLDYAAKLSPEIEELGYFKAVKLGSRGLLVAQAVVSGAQIYHVWNHSDGNWRTNEGNKWGVTAKATLDVTMGAIGAFGGPIGLGISGAYFLGDAFGVWGDWGEIPKP